jgi:hypothetical protein
MTSMAEIIDRERMFVKQAASGGWGRKEGRQRYLARRRPEGGTWEKLRPLARTAPNAA